MGSGEASVAIDCPQNNFIEHINFGLRAQILGPLGPSG